MATVYYVYKDTGGGPVQYGSTVNAPPVNVVGQTPGESADWTVRVQVDGGPLSAHSAPLNVTQVNAPETIYAADSQGFMNSAGTNGWAAVRAGTGNVAFSINQDGFGLDDTVIKGTSGNASGTLYIGRGFLSFTVPNNGTIASATVQVNIESTAGSGSLGNYGSTEFGFGIRVYRPSTAIGAMSVANTDDWLAMADTSNPMSDIITTAPSGTGNYNIALNSSAITWMNSNYGATMELIIRDYYFDALSDAPLTDDGAQIAFSSERHLGGGAPGDNAADPKMYIVYS